MSQPLGRPPLPHSAGRFTTPVEIPTAPYQTELQTLAGGQTWLSPAVATLCVASAEASPEGSPLVFSYDDTDQREILTAWEELGQRTTAFTLCSDSPGLGAWLLACAIQLADSTGADAADAGCTCLPASPEGASDACRLIGAQPGAFGRQVATKTKARFTYYLLTFLTQEAGSAIDFTVSARLTEGARSRGTPTLHSHVDGARD
jgi:hypothetical protein